MIIRMCFLITEERYTEIGENIGISLLNELQNVIKVNIR